MKDGDNTARKRDAMRRISAVQDILRHWNPIGASVPATEYNNYAPPIVSMVARGCSLDELCAQLEEIRAGMGIGPFGGTDRNIAIEILRALRDGAGPT
jgi:hypothetical protein